MELIAFSSSMISEWFIFCETTFQDIPGMICMLLIFMPNLSHRTHLNEASSMKELKFDCSVFVNNICATLMKHNVHVLQDNFTSLSHVHSSNAHKPSDVEDDELSHSHLAHTVSFKFLRLDPWRESAAKAPA